MSEKVLLRQTKDGVATLTLNRPQKFNPLSEEMLDALQAELDDIGQDQSIRVVVIGAEGKAFSAGHDLKEMRATPTKAFYDHLFAKCSRMMLTINQLPQPVIARVQGIATAAGCQLVANCDLAIAAESARFATSGIRYGLFCSTPAVPVSRNIGRKKAMEMLLTGEFIDAQSAVAEGLINHAVPTDELDQAIQKLVDSIVSKSAVAIRIGKEMFYKQHEMGLADAYDYASEMMACNMLADDAAEGFDAFLEKRTPVWNHKEVKTN
ncbi:MAG: enoyl-CoA hydratase [Anaerolineae bacterium]